MSDALSERPNKRRKSKDGNTPDNFFKMESDDKESSESNPSIDLAESSLAESPNSAMVASDIETKSEISMKRSRSGSDVDIWIDQSISKTFNSNAERMDTNEAAGSSLVNLNLISILSDNSSTALIDGDTSKSEGTAEYPLNDVVLSRLAESNNESISSEPLSPIFHEITSRVVNNEEVQDLEETTPSTRSLPSPLNVGFDFDTSSSVPNESSLEEIPVNIIPLPDLLPIDVPVSEIYAYANGMPSEDESFSEESGMSDEYNEDSDNNTDNDTNLPDESIVFNEIINKKKPNYSWNFSNQLMLREHGFSENGRYAARSKLNNGFSTGLYSSRYVVERMKITDTLYKHLGCVNSLSFDKSGSYLCTGSDDRQIVVWDWARNKTKYCFTSGHKENIFQTKFISADGCMDIISSSRDGQVRRSIISSSGSTNLIPLHKHRGSVNKLVLVPQNPYHIISVGEDGFIRHNDLRSGNNVTDMIKIVNARNKRIRLFSISHHPFAPEICVSGCDTYTRIYDKRNMSTAVRLMCPSHLHSRTFASQITCSVYNYNGSEVLTSYTNEGIYLFDNKVYNQGEYLHSYKGHFNHKTIKGVNFFGPQSDFVISGSDCGHVFFWHKDTEAIINLLPGEADSVVNCLEPHPSIPILATSGLDNHVKIWTPTSKTYPPDLSDLETCVKRNLRKSQMGEFYDIDESQLNYFIRQFLLHGRDFFNTGFGTDGEEDDESVNVEEYDDNDRNGVDHIIDYEDDDSLDVLGASSDDARLDAFSGLNNIENDADYNIDDNGANLDRDVPQSESMETGDAINNIGCGPN